jgi:hypothetical protein
MQNPLPENRTGALMYVVFAPTEFDPLLHSHGVEARGVVRDRVPLRLGADEDVLEHAKRGSPSSPSVPLVLRADGPNRG